MFNILDLICKIRELNQNTRLCYGFLTIKEDSYTYRLNNINLTFHSRNLRNLLLFVIDYIEENRIKTHVKPYYKNLEDGTRKHYTEKDIKQYKLIKHDKRCQIIKV